MEIHHRDTVYQDAKKWVYEAGKIIKEQMNNPLNIETKSNANDLVTILDKQTEKFFVEKIKDKYPDHQIIGEEGYGDQPKELDGTIWVIDPIDGTMNFVHQKKFFAISVGILHNGVGEIGLIYDVMNDTLYHVKKGEGAFRDSQQLPLLSRNKQLNEAIVGMNYFWLCENRLVDYQVMQGFIRTVRGARTYGSAALELAYIADGTLDGYLSMRLSPWDVAAGIILLQEVGGIVSNIDGNEWDPLKKSSILASNPALHKTILDIIKKGRK
ncbi:inositol monophosphatase family protein [Oceanobacillus iheyensis]|uniref:inositol-phosphate phosphatase n=1 Tax=Oceanobacillus iheyensis (strain DSM 14371 / CIP 107618 / JCM 11309 / KCTC 3954 / HTE831) TaxID=221109 RepID=Q8ER90_OCEIH|nr:inositol monophosphatase family protein [Oceanobacillus iheyensis]BAC13378.1 myo-inositol-1(or 4)-monophosphatase [Oceanobacillus iheyensis HTE831]